MTIVRYEGVDLSLQRESIFLPSYEASLIFAGPISSTLAFKSKKEYLIKRKKSVSLPVDFCCSQTFL